MTAPVSHRRKTPGRRTVVPRGARKTPGETLFEAYLRGQHAEVEHENYDLPPGTSKKPDYRVEIDQHVLYCEVKDLHMRKPLPERAVCFSPFPGIRKEIHDARKQFKGYRGHACVLVLHNVDDWEFCDEPAILFAAMLGDDGFSVPLTNSPAVDDESASIFLDGGKMLHKGRIQNTTFSALAVLREFEIPNPARIEEKKIGLSRIPSGLSPRERALREITVIRECREPANLGRVPALAVHENPFAAVPLPDGVLNGPYDARYRIDLTPRNGRYTGRIQRAFAGEELIAANQLLHANSGIYERIDRFARQITQQFHPERVILFGSHARGTAEPDSDVDLLVIFPGNRDLSEKALEIRRRINPEFPLDLLTRSAGQVARRCRLGDPFFTEILASGRLIYP